VRSDKSTKDVAVEDWNQSPEKNSKGEFVERITLSGGRKAGMSFSGNERNRLFVKIDSQFEDLSGVSGLDTKFDSRNIALIDYNRDGFQDFLVANTNGQLLQVFRNNLSETQSSRGNFVSVRLVGAKKDQQPGSGKGLSNRDGIGAWVTLNAGSLKLDREMRCGEGFATQNSSTILLGVGRETKVDSLKVRWPSGEETIAEGVNCGSLVTIFESKEDSTSGSGFDVEPYVAVEEVVKEPESVDRFPVDQFAIKSTKPVVLVTSMATWCQSSRAALGTITAIRDRFGSSVECFAFSTDESDSQSKLELYKKKFKPGYQFVSGDQDAVEAFRSRVIEQHGDAPLPSTLLLSADGEVVDVFIGVPNLSQVAEAIEELSRKTQQTR